MVIGHLAVAALQHRYLKADFTAVMAAAVFPDAVDKFVHYALRLAPSGRFWGHTLLGMTVSTIVVGFVWGRRVAASWLLGYASHLVCDMGSVVPWLHPWMTYEFPEPHTIYESLELSLDHLPRLGLELALSIWAVLALRPQMRSGGLRVKPRHSRLPS